jgi:CHAT domain-containing protein
LIGAEEEVRRIASELAGRTVFHIGADDRKEYLRASGNSAPILHLATHAVADTTAIDQSRILFSSRDGSGGADYLFLKEAYELPLDHVELAVLSACDTERGQMLRGEGVQSFSRAFLAAGARSTVTTLWRVPDRATADFMALFYHALQQGVPRDEALRRAKLRFLQSGTSLSDPHYWAAFVVTGDALRPVARSIAWTTLGAGTAGCAALATLTIFGIRHVRRRA